jgi:hypothetical protein
MNAWTVEEQDVMMTHIVNEYMENKQEASAICTNIQTEMEDKELEDDPNLRLTKEQHNRRYMWNFVKEVKAVLGIASTFEADCQLTTDDLLKVKSLFDNKTPDEQKLLKKLFNIRGSAKKPEMVAKGLLEGVLQQWSACKLTANETKTRIRGEDGKYTFARSYTYEIGLSACKLYLSVMNLPIDF